MTIFPLRNVKRSSTDDDKIQDFLQRAKIGFLGLSSDDVPYVIPLNFSFLNNAIYFHGAEEGRKITYIEQNSRACFTISENYGTITSPVPAKTDTAFMSIIIEGNLERVTDLDEATAAMQVMLDKYVPGYYDKPLGRTHLDRYVSPLGSKTAIFKLSAASLTAKEKAEIPDRMFYEGRTVKNDLA